MKSFNINGIVKVKLTPRGIDIFYHQYDELNERAREMVLPPLEPHMPEIDKDGFTEIQLWRFMDIYGKHMRMGLYNVIENNRIYIEEKDLMEE